jgi:hypothetical protein
MHFRTVIFAAAALLLSAHTAGAQDQRAARAHGQKAVFCAREGGHCGFQGIATVRYGARGRYVTRDVIGGIPCSSQVFGDPYPGARKSCFFFLVLGVGY